MAIKDITGCVAAYEADVAYSTGTTQCVNLDPVATIPNAKGSSLGFSDLLQTLACCRPVWMIDPADGLPFIRFGLTFKRSQWNTAAGTFIRKFMNAQVVPASVTGGDTFLTRMAYGVLARVTAIYTGTSGASAALFNLHNKAGSGTDHYWQIAKTFGMNVVGNTPSPVIPCSMGWSFYTYRGGFSGAEGGYRMARDQRVYAPNASSGGSNNRNQLNLGYLDGSVTAASFSNVTHRLTKTGAFTNYTPTDGDRILVTGGTGVTPGLYEIDETACTADYVTLLTDPAAGTPADVTFEGAQPVQTLYFDLRAFWVGSANGAPVPDASIATFVSEMEAKWGASATKTRRYSAITDSLAIQNVGVTTKDVSETLACQVSRRLPQSWEILVDALPGRKIATGTDPGTDTFTNVFVPLLDTSLASNTMVAAVGVNDLSGTNGMTGATWYTAYASWLSTIGAGGYTPIARTMSDAYGGYATGGSNTIFAVQRLAANVLVRAGTTRVSDVGSILQTGNRYASQSGVFFDYTETGFSSSVGAIHKIPAGIAIDAECDAVTVLAAAGTRTPITWQYGDSPIFYTAGNIRGRP